MLYCIGDVHGCYDDMMRLLEKIEKQDDDAYFLFMGDLVDHGPQVMEVLDWALEHISNDGRYRCIRGNHEEEVLLWYNQFRSWEKEKMHSLYPPTTKYDFFQLMRENKLLHSQKLEDIVELIQKLPYSASYRVTPEMNGKKGREVDYYFAHGWYDISETSGSERQHWANLHGRSCEGVSRREMEGYGPLQYQKGYIKQAYPVVICGHTPTVSGLYMETAAGNKPGANAPGLIGYRPHTIFVDGGCWKQWELTELPCMLCAFCPGNWQEIYSMSLEERMIGSLHGTLQDIAARGSRLDDYKRTYLSVENPYRAEMLSDIFDM